MDGRTATGRPKITYAHPFVHCLYVERANAYCFHCLRQLAANNNGTSSVRCAKCRFAVFCNAQCERECHEQFHRFECPLIAKSFPNAPSTHAILFARLLYRLKRDGIEICAPYECRPVAPRSWKNLLSHKDAVEACPSRMQKFEILKGLLAEYFDGAPPPTTDDDSSGPPRYTDEELFVAYCKKAVNSHGVFNQCGDLIGECLDFEASIYDHSCRPNMSITYDGLAITFSLLEDMKNGSEALRDPSRVHVSYVELAMSRTRRRRLLKERYYFQCQCERCLDLEDDLMTSIRCANAQCKQPLIGIKEDGVAVGVNCPVCRTTRTPHDVRQCQIMMRLIEKLTETWRAGAETTGVGGGDQSNMTAMAEDIFKKSMAMYERCRSYLHTTNLYLTDLRLTYVLWAVRTKTNLDVALRFALESLECIRLCYPRFHKLLGFHLLKIAYLFIALDEDYKKAQPYVDEAVEIMSRWFGGGSDEHNNVCQRLDAFSAKLHAVLYGGEKASKEEMLGMMKFY